uniref:Uncharacterized protein n=1 Tax=Salvator merianae TaxID=96440 RepID=A0A8D0BHN8_SALMN
SPVCTAPNLVKNFSDEAICSICLEYFKDPVTVDCGHNFCQVCITRCLEEAEGKPSCPQCRETISQRNFRPNRQLTNLVELIKNLQQEIQEEEKRGVCGKHQDVTLDPDTAHPCLFISEDRSSVKKEDCDQKLPLKPGRFDTMWCVLGCEKFTAGRHYWVVEIKGKQAGWVIGVAQETVKRKGYINFSPEEGIWAIQCCFCKIDNLPQFRISSLTSPLQTIISQSWKLSKIRVSLDYEAGYVAFSDACTGRSIFTFSSACFVEKRVCPFFRAAGQGALTRAPLLPLRPGQQNF